MNALKDLIIYCQNNDLDPAQEMRRWSEPTVSIEGARPLSWDEVDVLTRGSTGTFSCPCPYCGPEKRNSKRFQIRWPQSITHHGTVLLRRGRGDQHRCSN
jgi:hypothetical protein